MYGKGNRDRLKFSYVASCIGRSGGLMVSVLVSELRGLCSSPGARFLNVLKSFRTGKAITKSQPYDYRAVLITYR